MIYEGKLYGKIGSRYIPLKMTSDDVHAQAAEIAAMREAIKKGYDALTECVDDSGELLAEHGWWKDEPRCGYQIRYDEHKQRIENAEAALTKLKLFIL